MRRSLLLLILFWCYQLQPLFAQADRAELARKLQAKLDSLVKQSSLPGGVSASVVLPDGLVLTVVAGYADREAQRLMTAETLMIQGSVGKTYVASIAMQLLHEKKLTLNDKLSTYLGREPWYEQLPNSTDVTVKMLMNHTSGIMRYELDPKFTTDLTNAPTKEWLPAERLRYVLGKKPRFAAGQGWDYSDTNYIVLGMIIEKMTGKPIEELIRTRLLIPLGLKQTMPSE
jgi:D-alanyl-D-alanine carboxypeptidase